MTLPLLNDNLTIVSGILTSLTLLIPAVRKAIASVWRWLHGCFRPHVAQDKAQSLLLEKFASLEAILIANGERLITIEKEMRFNGGKTIKDMLFLMFSYRRHDFWRIGYPAMEIDGDARVTLVSEATCRLFGVVNPDDLKRHSWLTFTEKSNVEDLLRAYKDAVSYQSTFNWKIFVRTSSGVSQGEWEIRASPISDINASNKIYCATLIPVCPVAKRVAKDLQIAGLISCDLCQWKIREEPA